MSKQPDKGKGDLPPLPSPRSPQPLDDKILAHARANAPARKAHWQPGWGGGLATAAVLVLGVYLTQLTEVEVEQAASAPPASAPALQREADRPAASYDMAPRELAADKALSGMQADSEIEVEAMAASASAAMAVAAESQAARAKAKSAPAMEPLEVQQQLQQLRALLDQGEIEQANESYARLLEACPVCGLPPTLEQALAP